MARRKRAAAAEASPPEEVTTPAQSIALAQPPPSDVSEDAAPAGPPVPTVGDIVWTIDRSRAASAEQAGRTPEPLAAIVVRIDRNKENQPNGLIRLSIMDPEFGPLPKSDVPFSPTLKAGHWTPRPVRVQVPMRDLTAAIEVVLDKFQGERLPPLE